MTAALVALPERLRKLKEINFAETIHIPPSITDLDSFREWSRSDAYPEYGDVFWIDGVIWVDTQMEQLDFHNAVTTEFSRVLSNLVKEEKTGHFHSDGARLVHKGAGLSVEPDLLFYTKETLRSGEIRRIPGATSGTVELEGTPDMVLEIVSDSSEKKDTIDLREKYWQAGISEYWLVDARGGTLRFEILRRGPKKYLSTRKIDGKLLSNIFECRFKLTMVIDSDGIPEYTLTAS